MSFNSKNENTYIIRDAQMDDAHLIANVLVESWKNSFKEIVPKEFLQNMQIEDVAEGIKKALENRPIFTAELDGKIIGFAGYGSNRIKDYESFDSELHAIHILPGTKGKGVGSRLFNEVAEALRTEGNRNMIVAVFENNHANLFYKKHGGEFIGTRQVDYGGKWLTENLYGFHL